MRLRKYQANEGFSKRRLVLIRLESLGYHRHIVRVCTQPWHAMNNFIFPGSISQDLCAKNKEIEGERAPLLHSSTQGKKTRRPTIVLDTTSYICCS